MPIRFFACINLAPIYRVTYYKLVFRIGYSTINGVKYMNKKHNEDKKWKKDKKQINEKNNIEIWEDLVHIKDLLIALLICVSTTFLGYFIAPNEPPKPLFFGLIGAMIGFIITSIIINPKRELLEGDGED